MPLAQDLIAVSQRVAEAMGVELWSRMNAAVAALPAADIEAGFVQAHAPAPDFVLPDLFGLPVRLSATLRDGPVLLLFYRGAWCPYCRATLEAYEAIAPEVRVAGGRLLALSPQTPEDAAEFRRYAKLSFDLLTDAGARTAAAYGVAFALTPALEAVYAAMGEAPIATRNAAGDSMLAFPAAFVIATDGVVRWMRGHHDFRLRPEPEDALAALRRAAAG